MNKLCRQVSIESPGPTIKDCVFSFEIPVPDVPSKGARIRVVCAGACYRLRRSTSISSISSVSSTSSLSSEISQDLSCGTAPILPAQSPAHHGLRDGALFPGYEVAGIVEALGTEVEENEEFKVGDRVVLYPYEGIPHGFTASSKRGRRQQTHLKMDKNTNEEKNILELKHLHKGRELRPSHDQNLPHEYAEFIIVPELQYLVKIPDSISLSVAAMLPTGALLAMNTVFLAHGYVENILREQGDTGSCKILIVGTGGLALWAMRIAGHHYQTMKNQVSITVASLKDEGFLLAKEYKKVNVVQWNEDLYEKQLIERTKDACQGTVDIVIDFGTTSRSLHRSLQCLNKGGVVFISSEVAEKLLPKFSRRAEERQQCIKPVDMGSIEQLRQLVELVGNGEV